MGSSSPHLVDAMCPAVPLDRNLARLKLVGRFGYNLKRPGMMPLLSKEITRPVYLYINNEQVELKDASAVWGK